MCACVCVRARVCSHVCPSVYLSFCLFTGGKKFPVPSHKMYHYVFSHSPSVGGTNFSFSYSWKWETGCSDQTVRWQEGSYSSAFIGITHKYCELFCTLSVNCSVWIGFTKPMRHQPVIVPCCHRSRALLCWVFHLLLCCDEHREAKGARTPPMALFIDCIWLRRNIKAMLKIARVS